MRPVDRLAAGFLMLAVMVTVESAGPDRKSESLECQMPVDRSGISDSDPTGDSGVRPLYGWATLSC